MKWQWLAVHYINGEQLWIDCKPNEIFSLPKERYRQIEQTTSNQMKKFIILGDANSQKFGEAMEHLRQVYGAIDEDNLAFSRSGVLVVTSDMPHRERIVRKLVNACSECIGGKCETCEALAHLLGATKDADGFEYLVEKQVPAAESGTVRSSHSREMQAFNKAYDISKDLQLKSIALPCQMNRLKETLDIKLTERIAKTDAIYSLMGHLVEHDSPELRSVVTGIAAYLPRIRINYGDDHPLTVEIACIQACIESSRWLKPFISK